MPFDQDQITKSLSIIGAGKVASVLANFFVLKGWSVHAIVSNDQKDAAILAERVRAQHASNSYDMIAGENNLLLLCVPDAAIIPVAERCANILSSRPSRPLVLHTSGLRTSDDLLPFKSIGCLSASFHPIQTFYSIEMTATLCDGIGVGIEGDTSSVNAATALALALGWNALHVAKEHKALYHAACVFASNYVTTLAASASSLLSKSCIIHETPGKYFLPMMHIALQAIDQSDPANALTGPIARGDLETVKEHIRAITELSKEHLPDYMYNAQITARFARENRIISEKKYQDFFQLLTLHQQGS